MRLTDARQGVRMLKFMDCFGRGEAAALTQSEAAELLGVKEIAQFGHRRRNSRQVVSSASTHAF